MKRFHDLVFSELGRSPVSVTQVVVVVKTHGGKVRPSGNDIRQRCAGFLWEFSSRKVFPYGVGDALLIRVSVLPDLSARSIRPSWGMTSLGYISGPAPLPQFQRWVVRFALLAAMALAFVSVCAAAFSPDATSILPFSQGERISYNVTLANGTRIGTAAMWIDGPVELRGTRTLLLRFDSRIRFLLVPAVSSSSSWYDPARGASLRFLKRERNPLTNQTDSVELYPDEKRWESADGEVGESPTSAPLDELSFIYFVRTLPMNFGATYSFDRHFEVARNPIKVSIIRREVIPTPMGELHVIHVEMRVRDPRHYQGEGVIRIHLSDDQCRLPVRMESTMPVVGTAILTIKSQQSRCQIR